MLRQTDSIRTPDKSHIRHLQSEAAKRHIPLGGFVRFKKRRAALRLYLCRSRHCSITAVVAVIGGKADRDTAFIRSPRRRAVHLSDGLFSALKPRNAHPAANPKSNRAIGGPKSRTGITRKSPVVLNPP